MEVLQAVHLLLAYPLFVVVVGDDPRWLLHTLQGTFNAFRANRKRQPANADMWQTTPQNYLEKIFQIPFSLKPMTSEGYSDLIGALLLPTNKEEKPLGTAKQQGPRPTEAPPSPVGGNGAIVPKEGKDRKDPSEQVPHSVKDSEATRAGFVIHEESLTVKPGEAKFAENLFALIPTPRAAKRFSNVYRILKAPIRRDRLRLFEGTSELPGEFQVPMLLLAILIGAPAEAVEVFPRLWRMALAKQSPLGALRRITATFESSDGLRVLQEKIRPIVSRQDFPDAAELYKEWIPRVSRFSFDVGRAVESTRYELNVDLLRTSA